MALNWIDVRNYSFNSLLLFEQFQIRYMVDIESEDFSRALGAALKANPAVAWYLARRCPERAEKINGIVERAPAPDKAALREAEVLVMSAAEDFVTFTTPEIMDQASDYIYAWDRERLYELADFAGKRVLDVGTGSGRLAFAAAARAAEVYAVEPVGTLRRYLRDKIAHDGIPNMRVTDGMADSLPYPDHTFDIVMSGHVVGDDYEGELRELTRVVKPGGWLLDCPGEDPRKRAPNQELRRRGWEELYYQSKLGGDVYRYRKRAQ